MPSSSPRNQLIKMPRVSTRLIAPHSATDLRSIKSVGNKDVLDMYIIFRAAFIGSGSAGAHRCDLEQVAFDGTRLSAIPATYKPVGT